MSHFKCSFCGAELHACDITCRVCGANTGLPPKIPTCSECGARLGVGQKFCHACGVKQEEPKSDACPECGAPLIGGAAFCGECGAELPAAGGALIAPAPDNPPPTVFPDNLTEDLRDAIDKNQSEKGEKSTEGAPRAEKNGVGKFEIIKTAIALAAALIMIVLAFLPMFRLLVVYDVDGTSYDTFINSKATQNIFDLVAIPFDAAKSMSSRDIASSEEFKELYAEVTKMKNEWLEASDVNEPYDRTGELLLTTAKLRLWGEDFDTSAPMVIIAILAILSPLFSAVMLASLILNAIKIFGGKRPVLGRTALAASLAAILSFSALTVLNLLTQASVSAVSGLPTYLDQDIMIIATMAPVLSILVGTAASVLLAIGAVRARISTRRDDVSN